MRSVLSHIEHKGVMLDHMVALLSPAAKLNGKARIMLKEWDVDRMAEAPNGKATLNDRMRDTDLNIASKTNSNRNFKVVLGPSHKLPPAEFRQLFADKGLAIDQEVASVCTSVVFENDEPLKCMFWSLKLA